MGQNRNIAGNGQQLGTQFRGKLAQAFGQRGKYGTNLWFVYSPKTERDWVLHSNLEYDYFLLTEADPTIQSVNYAPEPILIKNDQGETKTTTFDAEVVRQDGTVEWHEVKSLYNLDPRTERQKETQTIAANIAGVTYHRYTEEQLHNNLTLLANLRRLLPWVAAARERALTSYHLEVAALLDARRSIKLADLHALGTEADFPLYMAAVLKGILNGALDSDLSTNMLSATTVVSLRRSKA